MSQIFGNVMSIWGPGDRRFTQFFPGWSELLTELLHTSCAQPYSVYASSDGESKYLINDVVDCLLSNFTESRKAEQAASGIILGLTPAVLQSISSSTAESSLLALRRPALAFLLAAGAPVVNVFPASQYKDPVDALERPVRLSSRPGLLSKPSVAARALLVLLQYVAALAAAANIAILERELGFQSISVFVADKTFYPAFWTYVALAIHFAGVVALRWKVGIVRKSEGRPDCTRWICQRLKEEATISAYGPPLILEMREASYLSEMLAWAIHLAIYVHIIFGTVIFSTLLLIDIRDSVYIIGRYMTSAVVSRAILRYELVGLREATCGVKTE